MKVRFHDFNGADTMMNGRYAKEWAEVAGILQEMPLQVKASDQDGLQGTAVFDPKANNAAIAISLNKLGWKKANIPEALSFLGKDVDFTKNGIVIEAQFSSYPFALNNVVRTTILMAEKVALEKAEVCGLVLVTKSKMFQAAQSTLYYEQAVHQMEALTKYKILGIPTRVVGLFEDIGTTVNGVWTEYPSKRHARKPKIKKNVRVEINASAVSRNGRTSGICSLTVK